MSSSRKSLDFKPIFKRSPSNAAPTPEDYQARFESAAANLKAALQLGELVPVHEFGEGMSGTFVFLMEHYQTPSTEEPESLIFKFGNASQLRDELRRYMDFEKLEIQNTFFSKLLEPRRTLSMLRDGTTGCICYQSVEHQFLSEDSVPLDTFIQKSLVSESPPFNDIEDIASAIGGSLAELEKHRSEEFAEPLSACVLERIEPNFRCTAECMRIGEEWEMPTPETRLLTLKERRPPHFYETRGDHARSTESWWAYSEDVTKSPTIGSLNLEGLSVVGVRDSIVRLVTAPGTPPSRLIVDVDVKSLTREEIKIVEEAPPSSVDIWLPVDSTRASFYRNRVIEAFGSIPDREESLKIIGQQVPNPLQHLGKVISTVWSSDSMPKPSYKAPAHGDLHLGNLIQVRSSASFIDYGLFTLSAPVGFDHGRLITNLLVHVFTRVLGEHDLILLLLDVFKISTRNEQEITNADQYNTATKIYRSFLVKATKTDPDGDFPISLLLNIYGSCLTSLRWNCSRAEHRAAFSLASICLRILPAGKLNGNSPHELFPRFVPRATSITVPQARATKRPKMTTQEVDSGNIAYEESEAIETIQEGEENRVTQSIPNQHERYEGAVSEPKSQDATVQFIETLKALSPSTEIRWHHGEEKFPEELYCIPKFLVFRRSSSIILTISQSRIDPYSLQKQGEPVLKAELIDPDTLREKLGFSKPSEVSILPKNTDLLFESVDRIFVDADIVAEAYFNPAARFLIPTYHRSKNEQKLSIPLDLALPAVQEHFHETEILPTRISRKPWPNKRLLSLACGQRPLSTRFAPSPTGGLHLGNARTAFLSYLFYLRYGSAEEAGFLLRFDDTDKQRSSRRFVNQIKSELRWLGLSWTSEIQQSDRQSESYYDTALKLLQETGQIVIDRDGRVCLKQASKRNYFHLWFDLRRGPQVSHQPPIDTAGYEKTIALKRNESKLPFYRFAGLVDDVTLSELVVRDDSQQFLTQVQSHIRQCIQRAAFSTGVSFRRSHSKASDLYLRNDSARIKLPIYVHAQRLVDKQGKKLSKRESNYKLSIQSLRDAESLLPEAIAGYLLWTILPKSIEAYSSLRKMVAFVAARGISVALSELASQCDFSTLTRSSKAIPVCFEEVVLADHVALCNIPIWRYQSYLASRLRRYDADLMPKIDEIYRNRFGFSRWKEIVNLVEGAQRTEGIDDDTSLKTMRSFLKNETQPEQIIAKIDRMIKKENAVRLFRALRVVVYGKSYGPPVSTLLNALPAGEIYRRMRVALRAK